MNNADQWISLEYRLPTEADLPIWVYCPECKKDHGAAVIHSFDCYAYKKVPNTHWKHAKSDIPAPPRAKTLAELDAEAFKAWRGTFPRYALATYEMAFIAGIAYERAEVAKIIGDFTVGNECTTYDKLRNIAERVKGTAAR